MIEKTNLNPSEVGDIIVGTVSAPGSQRATECRMAAFYAGFPGNFSLFFPLNLCFTKLMGSSSLHCFELDKFFFRV